MHYSGLFLGCPLLDAQQPPGRSREGEARGGTHKNRVSIKSTLEYQFYYPPPSVSCLFLSCCPEWSLHVRLSNLISNLCSTLPPPGHAQPPRLPLTKGPSTICLSGRVTTATRCKRLKLPPFLPVTGRGRTIHMDSLLLSGSSGSTLKNQP